MSLIKTRNIVTCLITCVIIAIRGKDATECTTSEIRICSDIVNFTQLKKTNYTITDAFCGDDYIRFKTCMEPLRDLCSPVILRLLDDLISTLEYICASDQLSLLQRKTSCLTSLPVKSHLDQCQKSFRHGIGNSHSVGGICQRMVDFLSCSRWTAWASCGRDAADYMYRIQSHWVNMTIGTLGCTTKSREAPTGLLWSYVVEGYGIWTPATSAIMQLNGDPESWVPDYLRYGNFSKRHISSNRLARFGHLAADYWHNKLLWVDITGSSAHYAPIYFFEKESVPSTLVFGGMSKNVTAIAVDWVSQNLYWTDAGYQWIGLVPYKAGHMGHHVILFDTDLLTPSGIITDPAKGCLYWTDMDRGVIERSTLSGRHRRVLHRDLSLPTSLAIDYTTSYLYWLGTYRHTIYSAHTDGGAIIEIRREGLTVVYNDLSVYEDYIFVTVNKADLVIYSKNNGTKLNKIGVDTNRNYEETYAVTVSAASKQQPINNRCYYDNGGCQQVCVINVDSADGVLCMCTVGYHLAADGKRCLSEPLQDNFLLIADSYGKDLYMLSVDGSTVTALPIAPDSIPQAVVFIPENDTVLWYDEKMSALKQTNIKDTTSATVHSFGSATVRAIAHDKLKNNLYFSDARSGSIKYFLLNGEFSSETTLIRTEIPADIVLDINERVIYWTEWKNVFIAPGIYSADMDTGKNKKLLVNTDMYYPSGLNIHFRDKKMFWCDAYTDKIYEYDLMSRERIILVNKTGATFYSMTMQDDHYLYVSDLSIRTLLRYDLQTSDFEEFGPKIFQKAVSIRLYMSSLQDVSSSTILTASSSQSTSSSSVSTSSAPAPKATTAALTWSTRAPTTSTLAPTVSTSAPKTSASASSAPAPTSTPATASPSSARASPSPATSSPSPATASPSSATASPSPATASPSPATTSPSPATTSPSPATPVMTSSPSPVAASPQSTMASTSASTSTLSSASSDKTPEKPRGATNQPNVSRVSSEDRLTDGWKAGIIITVIIIVALIIATLIVIYKRKGYICHFCPGRMFSRRRMDEDTLDVRMDENSVRDIDV